MSWPVDFELERIFGCNVKRARERAGLTQLELGALIGVGQSTISQMESGRQFASWPTLLKLCEQLDVGLADLLITSRSTRRRKKAA